MGKPVDFGRDGDARGECICETVTNVWRATDPGEERGLKKTWDAKAGGDEDNAQGREWSDEEILLKRRVNTCRKN